MKKTKDEYNELRCLANEIMHELYEAGETEQLDLLRRYAEVAIEHIKNKEKKK